MIKNTWIYKNHKIIIREFRRGRDMFRSFEILDNVENSIWLSDVLFEADYLEACKRMIDKRTE